MIRTIIAAIICAAATQVCLAQVSGNVAYSQAGGSARAKQDERNKRVQATAEIPPTGTSMFVDASVLMNVKADQYVAVFGIAQEGPTVADCNQKMDGVIDAFSVALKQLGIGLDDVFVDFIVQNKVYHYERRGDILAETLAGFELKKNVAVHFRDKLLLDKLILAAGRSQVFDLIKVDYIVTDTHAVEDKLLAEAAEIIRRKSASYEKLFGIKLQQPAVYASKPSIYFPTELYSSYVAQESEEVLPSYNRDRYTVESARKSSTIFFNGLDADGFDTVINPVMIEPVVQFTLYLKVKYETGEPKAGK
jgi:uncharacterized protein YggE